MNISYKLKFQFKIRGCRVQEIITDKSILEFLSDEYNTVTEICFTYACDGKDTTLFSVELNPKIYWRGIVLYYIT